MTNEERITCLEELLEIIIDDWKYCCIRREQAFTEEVKSYYDRRIERAQWDCRRITRSIRKLKAAAQEETSC